jgi:hypothetical protein
MTAMAAMALAVHSCLTRQRATYPLMVRLRRQAACREHLGDVLLAHKQSAGVCLPTHATSLFAHAESHGGVTWRSHLRWRAMRQLAYAVAWEGSGEWRGEVRGEWRGECCGEGSGEGSGEVRGSSPRTPSFRSAAKATASVHVCRGMKALSCATYAPPVRSTCAASASGVVGLSRRAMVPPSEPSDLRPERMSRKVAARAGVECALVGSPEGPTAD